MLEFKEIKIEDAEVFGEYLGGVKEFSCETSFINLLIWGKAYDNQFALSENHLFIKSSENGEETFRLPFGPDFEKGIELVRRHTGSKYPVFWAQDGTRFNEFKELYGEHYDFIENRDALDYIYNTEDLAQLSGKKYHSKRNHISALSRQCNWRYEKICTDNIDKIRICADKWYEQKSDRMDKYMQTERTGIETLLSNMERLNASGGGIFVGADAVAFTLGSPINNEVFDIHIEKALDEFSSAYAVINNQFAKNGLSGYKYINREDDLGLEGLRRAKLSYKPQIMLKKYLCLPR